MTLYDDLGLAAAASDVAIKAAHREGVKRHHPDAGGDRDRFDRIQRAFDVLGDPDRRRRYDETGSFDQTPPPKLEQEALGVLQAILTELIGGPQDLTRLDLMGTVLAILAARREAAVRRSLEADTAIARIADVRARLSRSASGGEGDPLPALFDHQLREAQALKLRVQRAVQVHGAAMTLIRGYAYRIDGDQASITFEYSAGSAAPRIDGPAADEQT